MARDAIREAFEALKTGDEVQSTRDLTLGHLSHFTYFREMLENGFRPSEADNPNWVVFSNETKMKVTDSNIGHGSAWVELERDSFPKTSYKLSPEEFSANFEVKASEAGAEG